jgi:eukaryotic-like serine/threonine-protein kinase
MLIGIAAAVVVLAVVGIAIALSGTLTTPPPATTAPSAEDAVLEQTVPSPEVADGVPSADGSAVTFSVTHDRAEEGDRYRWSRSDGSGTTQVADGPTITVDGVVPGAPTCIDVQVQRGSKVSDAVRGCTP